MVVEPESLCWLTGRMVQTRDGATWAEEFARFGAEIEGCVAGRVAIGWPGEEDKQDPHPSGEHFDVLRETVDAERV